MRYSTYNGNTLWKPLRTIAELHSIVVIRSVCYNPSVLSMEVISPFRVLSLPREHVGRCLIPQQQFPMSDIQTVFLTLHNTINNYKTLQTLLCLHHQKKPHLHVSFIMLSKSTFLKLLLILALAFTTTTSSTPTSIQPSPSNIRSQCQEYSRCVYGSSFWFV